MTMNAALSKLENIPAELRPLPVWLLWKSVPNGKDKPKKVPYYADGKVRQGVLDIPEDRARLVTLDAALSKFNSKRHTGLGVALGKIPDMPERLEPLSGIDCDNCVRGEEIAAAVKDVLAAAGEAYAEISPSGTGLKIFGIGNIGSTATPELEIYSGARFFAVTGLRIQGDHLADLTAAAEVARRRLLMHTQTRGRKTGRNTAMTSFAGSLRARNTPDAEAWELLKNYNLEVNAPPLDERELRAVFDSVWKYPPGFKLTDLGNAERLVARHGDDLRYIEGVGWATWDEHRWNTQQADGHVMVMVKDTVRAMYVEAAQEEDEKHRKRLADHARASESRNRLDAAAKLAEWQPEVADNIANFDTDPLLLGLLNGVYDLRRDQFRAGRREDRITLQAGVAYDEQATCPRWERFQLEIHDGNNTVVAFKQRAWGYTLTGDTSEQVLFIPNGEGANGKSTELSIMQTLMGDYARKVGAETLMVRDGRAASNDVARLRGARFLPTVEVEDGQRMAESLVKQLTGEDAIAARFMYREFFEFVPVGKIWLATNHRPEISGTDYAIWRRILLIPYPVKFEGARKDAGLKQQLLAELPGILNWTIAGFRAWRVSGLAAPDSVRAASESYRVDMDRVGNFLRECCKHGPGVKGRTAAAQVYRTYEGWMRDNGLRPLSSRKFHERMQQDHKLYRVGGDTGPLSDYPHLLLVATGREEIGA